MSRFACATPGADTVRYGGNTSVPRGHARQRAPARARRRHRACGRSAWPIDGERVDELHILLTHLHLDHLQGLGFFRPLFRPDLDVHLWGPASPVQSLEERIAIYLSPPLFPVRLADIPARLTFHDAPEQPRHHRLGRRCAPRT